ncbi:MAG TPA: LacI family DNA-binding transcriptional regulator [Terriglobales bacterium]|nr:LacI family DNA-binding transcriptional regulator [Terriglobales bacterium]
MGKAKASNGQKLAIAGRVTLADVAEHAGVSRSTASLVVRNSNLIPEATHEKVRSSMQALGYIYNQGAANLRKQKSATLGIVLADMTNPFYATLALGMEQICHEQGYVTVFANSGEDSARQRLIIERLVEHNVAGVLLCSADNRAGRDLDILRSAATPVVEIMRRVEGGTETYIGPDNIKGMGLVVDHLAALRRKRIAFLGGPVGKSSSKERLQGFTAAMRRNKIPVDQKLVLSLEINRRSAMEATLDLLKQQPAIDAIVCYNDVIALGALLALQRLDLKAGHDLSLVGFDDIPEASLWTPSLTTVAIDPLRIGRLAATELLRRVAEPGMPAKQIIIEPQLIIRESCGADWS